MVARTVKYVLLALLGALWLLPLYLMVINASVSLDAYAGSPVWLPTGFDLATNAATAWGAAGLGAGFLNSLLYATVAAGLAVASAALAGFAVVVMPTRRPMLWFWIIYAGTLLPLQIFLLPLYSAYVGTQTYDTQYGMILIYAAICVPFAFFIIRNQLTTIPKEIVEAAQLDGAGWWTIFTRIHLRLMLPALFAAFIFQFTWVWNDLLFGITLSTSGNIRPVMAALAEINGGYAALSPPVVLAGAILVSAPTIILFLAAQRSFAGSLAVTS